MKRVKKRFELSILGRIKAYFITKKTQIKFDYLKYNFGCKILTICYKIMWFFIAYLLILLLLFLLYLIYKEGIIDLIEKISNESIQELFDIGLILFGIEITLLSIVIGIKQKNVYDINEYKLVLKYNFGPYKISHLLVISFIFFIISILAKLFEEDFRVPTIFLVLSSLLTIVSLIIIINMSTAKLHYHFNNYGKNNKLKRREGNVLSIVKDNKQLIKNLDIIYEKSMNNTFLSILEYVDIFYKKVFYSKAQIEPYDIELFKIYTKDYFKNISNDAEIISIDLFLNDTGKMLEYLAKEGNYKYYVEILYTILNELCLFMENKYLLKRFRSFSLNECRIMLLYNDFPFDLYLRNMMIYEFFSEAFENFVNLNSRIIENEGNNIYFLDKGNIEEKIYEIYHKIKTLNESNENLYNNISSVRDEFRGYIVEAKTELNKLNEK